MASLFNRMGASPVVKAAFTSATVMCAGDLCCQAIQQRHQQVTRLDVPRALRFGLVGLTLHGPFFYHGFRMLDQRFGGAPTLKRALIKTAVGQLTLFPVYTSALFLYLGTLEGKTLQQSWQRLQERFPVTLATGSIFWPAVNLLNFLYVAPTQRVLYVNAAGLVWNTFLSWVTSKEVGQRPGQLIQW